MSGYNKADSLKKFNVTFDGERDGKSFGIKGDATGVALQIIDTHGHVIEPGKSMPLIDSSPEYNQLDYAIRLITDRQTLKSGIFWSHIKFRLDYFASCYSSIYTGKVMAWCFVLLEKLRMYIR